MNSISRPHPAQVPTLTEIIDVQGQQAAAQPARTAAQPVVNPPAVTPFASNRPPVPLDTLPVLGEVVASPAVPRPATSAPVAAPPVAQPTSAAPATAPEAAPPAFTEAQLAHRVLSDVQRQVDGMLEFRLKEAMAPVLARHTEAIVRDLRDELNRTLKDVVARSVAQELAKLRQR